MHGRADEYPQGIGRTGMHSLNTCNQDSREGGAVEGPGNLSRSASDEMVYHASTKAKGQKTCSGKVGFQEPFWRLLSFPEEEQEVPSHLGLAVAKCYPGAYFGRGPKFQSMLASIQEAPRTTSVPSSSAHGQRCFCGAGAGAPWRDEEPHRTPHFEPSCPGGCQQRSRAAAAVHATTSHRRGHTGRHPGPVGRRSAHALTFLECSHNSSRWSRLCSHSPCSPGFARKQCAGQAAWRCHCASTHPLLPRTARAWQCATNAAPLQAGRATSGMPPTPKHTCGWSAASLAASSLSKARYIAVGSATPITSCRQSAQYGLGMSGT